MKNLPNIKISEDLDSALVTDEVFDLLIFYNILESNYLLLNKLSENYFYIKNQFFNGLTKQEYDNYFSNFNADLFNDLKNLGFIIKSDENYYKVSSKLMKSDNSPLLCLFFKENKYCDSISGEINILFEELQENDEIIFNPKLTHRPIVYFSNLEITVQSHYNNRVGKKE